jgi:hypothetical protein
LGYRNKIKLIVLSGIFLLGMLLASCATQKPNYPVKKKRGKKCDCPDWSFRKMKTVEFTNYV